MVVKAIGIRDVEPHLLKRQIAGREVQTQKPILLVDRSCEMRVGIDIGDGLT